MQYSSVVKLCRKLYSIILSRRRLSYCLAVTVIKKLCTCEYNYEVSHKLGDHVSLYTVTLDVKLKPTIKSLTWATLTITLHYEQLKFYPLLICLLNVAVSKTL